MKVVWETQKIFGEKDAVCAHSEAITIETEEEVTPEAATEILKGAPGVQVVDNPAEKQQLSFRCLLLPSSGWKISGGASSAVCFQQVSDAADIDEEVRCGGYARKYALICVSVVASGCVSCSCSCGGEKQRI
ncbi:asd [Symbiodinium microadriaticum]|nr:asd [Symbiodinium microadriaticum]